MSGPLEPAAAERPEPESASAFRGFQGKRRRSVVARLRRLRIVTVATEGNCDGRRERKDYRSLLMTASDWNSWRDGYVERHRNATLAEHEYTIGAMTKALEQQVDEEGNHTASQWKEVQEARSKIKLLDEAWRESDRRRRVQAGLSGLPAE